MRSSQSKKRENGILKLPNVHSTGKKGSSTNIAINSDIFSLDIGSDKNGVTTGGQNRVSSTRQNGGSSSRFEKDVVI